MDVDAESFIDTCGSLVKWSYAVHSLLRLKYICRQELPFSSGELGQYKIGKVGKQIFVTSIDVFRDRTRGFCIEDLGEG